MNKKLFILSMLILCLALAAACGQKAAPTQANATAQGQGQSQAQNVAVVKLDKTNFTSTISLVGQISPSAEVKVAPKSSGKVEQVYVDVGEEVSAGTVLLKLNDSDLQIQLQKTQIQLNDAKLNLDRKKALLDSGAVSKLEYETAESSYNNVRVTLEQNQNDVANTEVRSPINGIVTARNINPGEFVSNSSSAFIVVNIDTVQVNASLMEDEVNFIKPGQAVDVVVPAITDTPFLGVVTKISPYADAKEKTYPLWVSVENKDHVLKPGMFAELSITFNKRENVIVVPNTAIVERNGKRVVYVADGDKAVEKAVKIGITQSAKAEIIEGLSPGDLLITSGLQTMKDGKAIAIQSDTPGKKQTDSQGK